MNPGQEIREYEALLQDKADMDWLVVEIHRRFVVTPTPTLLRETIDVMKKYAALEVELVAAAKAAGINYGRTP